MPSTRWSADGGARALALTGLLSAMACVLGLVESAWLPPLPVPGVRLGLANLAVVAALAALGPRRALVVTFVRVVVVGSLASSLAGPGFVMGLCGALAAWCAMALLWLGGSRFSAIGWSVGGAAAHVVAQLVAASVLAGSTAPLLLSPLSLALGLLCGLGVGYAARALLSVLPLVSSVTSKGSALDGAETAGARVRA